MKPQQPWGVVLSFVATAVLAFILAITGITAGEIYAFMLGCLVTLLVLIIIMMWMDQPRRIERRRQQELNHGLSAISIVSGWNR